MACHDQRHDGVRAGACRPGPPRPEAGARVGPRRVQRAALIQIRLNSAVLPLDKPLDVSLGSVGATSQYLAMWQPDALGVAVCLAQPPDLGHDSGVTNGAAR